jgi:predicted site-specific integrase-resolvase
MYYALIRGNACVNKFAQSKNNFVCDFITSMNMCCAKLYNMYVDLEKKK